MSQDKVAARLDPANRPAAAVAVAVGRLSQHKAGGLTCWRSQDAEVFEQLFGYPLRPWFPTTSSDLPFSVGREPEGQ